MSKLSTQQAREQALARIAAINAVEGFDPSALVEEWAGPDGKHTKGLPVLAQIAWFRLRYPEGRLMVRVAPDKDGFVAHARVYHSCQDTDDQFLAEATAFRGPVQDHPEISPREWAQTAAIGIALRNAGFGLQFRFSGEPIGAGAEPEQAIPAPEEPQYEAEQPASPPGDPLEEAMAQPCVIKKYAGKTLGDLITLDPKALNWIARQQERFPEIAAAAKLICEHALEYSA